MTPAAPAVTLTQPTCAITTGNIVVTSPLGTGLVYSINGVTYQSPPSFNGVPSGTTYQVTVRLSAGCISAPKGIYILKMIYKDRMTTKTMSIIN